MATCTGFICLFVNYLFIQLFSLFDSLFKHSECNKLVRIVRCSNKVFGYFWLELQSVMYLFWSRIYSAVVLNCMLFTCCYKTLNKLKMKILQISPNPASISFYEALTVALQFGGLNTQIDSVWKALVICVWIMYQTLSSSQWFNRLCVFQQWALRPCVLMISC